MGACQTKMTLANHAALITDKEYQLAYKLLLGSGGEYIAILALFLGYIIASKFVK